jgi:hypothetical protein
MLSANELGWRRSTGSGVPCGRCGQIWPAAVGITLSVERATTRHRQAARLAKLKAAQGPQLSGRLKEKEASQRAQTPRDQMERRLARQLPEPGKLRGKTAQVQDCPDQVAVRLVIGFATTTKRRGKD